MTHEQDRVSYQIKQYRNRKWMIYAVLCMSLAWNAYTADITGPVVWNETKLSFSKNLETWSNKVKESTVADSSTLIRRSPSTYTETKDVQMASLNGAQIPILPLSGLVYEAPAKRALTDGERSDVESIVGRQP